MFICINIYRKKISPFEQIFCWNCVFALTFIALINTEKKISLFIASIPVQLQAKDHLYKIFLAGK